MTAVIPNDLAELFETGISILVGTRDAKLIPDATRAVGAVVHADRQHLTVFLPVGVADRCVANLKDNSLIAIGFSSILDHRSFQVKGVVETIAPATDAEHEVIRRYHAAFSEVLFFTGIPRALTKRMNCWPAHAVTYKVTEIFTQTPGPGAGELLKS